MATAPRTRPRVPTARDISRRLRKFASADKAKLLQGFFKTGPGQYGEGDIFIGVMVPDIRGVARECPDAPLREVLVLLKSPVHEERLLALLMLVRRFAEANDELKKKIYAQYLRNTKYINNWDLVDLSAPHIVGAYLLSRSRKPLYELAGSRDLWEKRIAVLSTLAFIRRNEFADTLEICRMLLDDEHDLIHKATGWMLREVGKRSLAAEERFLKRHSKTMPRTALRYAIERFPEAKRLRYLNGKARLRKEIKS
jgi:3-methyladenine DNA glycosylase AlkD